MPQIATLSRRKQQQIFLFLILCFSQVKKKMLKILLSTAQNNKTLHSFMSTWC